MKKMIAGIALASAVMMTGCVTIQSTREQLNSGIPAEIQKAEDNIYSIAAYGQDANRRVYFSDSQRVAFVELTSNRDLLLKILDNSDEKKVIRVAAAKLDLSTREQVLDIIQNHGKAYLWLKHYGYTKKMLELLTTEELRGLFEGKIGKSGERDKKVAVNLLLDRSEDPQELYKYVTDAQYKKWTAAREEETYLKIAGMPEKVTDRKIIQALITVCKQKSNDLLLSEEQRSALLLNLPEADAKAYALEAFQSYMKQPWEWAKDSGKALELPLVAASVVKSPDNAKELLGALLKTLTVCKKSCEDNWSITWKPADDVRSLELLKKLPVVSDDMLESIVLADSKTWHFVIKLMTDKARTAKVARTFFDAARATNRTYEIEQAWRQYGSFLSNEDLKTMAINDTFMREKALAAITDPAVKNEALAAIKAEQDRLVALRLANIKSVISVAEKDAVEFSKIASVHEMSGARLGTLKERLKGRVLYFKNAQIQNADSSGAPKGKRRTVIRAAYPDSSKLCFVYIDFTGEQRAAAAKLKNGEVASFCGIVDPNDTSYGGLRIDGMVVTKETEAQIPQFLNQTGISDKIIKEMLAEGESVMRKFAKDEYLEFPADEDLKRKEVSLGEALKAVGELGQMMDEYNEAKKEVQGAWDNLKGEVKKGINEVISEEDRATLKQSMDELNAAKEMLNQLTK